MPAAGPPLVTGKVAAARLEQWAAPRRAARLIDGGHHGPEPWAPTPGTPAVSIPARQARGARTRVLARVTALYASHSSTLTLNVFCAALLCE